MNNKFVSRAGQKLEHALSEFNIPIQGKTCIDFGCSTGGFTDCLLKRGAEKVYAIDTSYGTLDWNLRNDPKVIVMERTNALYVEIPEKADFISIDVNWTKQDLILPVALKFLTEKGDIVSLLKTHYEAEKSWLKEGRVMEEFLPNVIEKVKENISKLKLDIKGLIKSPLTGQKGGNTEYLLWIKKY